MSVALQGGIEVDATCSVVRVIDGDTFVCVLTEVSDGFESLQPGLEVRVRLADINTPELRPEPEPGALEATSMLASLLRNGTVYLDIDDFHVYDKYGRVIAVVLAPYNSSHLVNVNKLLISEGLADVWEHDNQWNIMETPLYVPAQPGQDYESGTGITAGEEQDTSTTNISIGASSEQAPGQTTGSSEDAPSLGMIVVVVILALFMLASSRR